MPANSPTDRLYTGQLLDNSTGLYYYGARFYDSQLGRFISPDSLVPKLGNPQALNRYAYTLNNPLKYNDPDGHWVHIAVGAAVGAAIAYGVQVVGSVNDNGLSVQAFTNVDVRAVAAGAVAGGVGAATLGMGTAAIAGAGLTGSAATAATGAAVAGSGVAAGQASRAVMGEELGRPEDMALDAAASLAGAGAGKAIQAATNSSKGPVRLYRAVSKPELQDLTESRQLKAGRNSVEGKWFAESAEDARRWGEALGGDNMIIAVDVPQETANRFFRIDRLDGIGPARYAEPDQLRPIAAWEVLP